MLWFRVVDVRGSGAFEVLAESHFRDVEQNVMGKKMLGILEELFRLTRCKNL